MQECYWRLCKQVFLIVKGWWVVFDSTAWSRVRSRRQPSLRQFIVHSHSRWDPSHGDIQAEAV